MAQEVKCVRCGQTREGIDYLPFPPVVEIGQRIAVAIGCVLGGGRQPGTPPNVETDDDAGRGDPAESRVQKLTSR